MRRKTLADWIFESLVTIFTISSFIVMAAGFFQQEWWAGLGLVILMPSLLCWFTMFWNPKQKSSQYNYETLSSDVRISERLVS